MPKPGPDTMEAKDKAHDQIKKAIGAKIQEVRRKRDQSALRVAGELGISRVALTQIESGRNNVSALLLWKIATILDCDIAELFPVVPKGHGLSRVERDLVRREDEKAVDWADQLFPTHK